MRRRTTHPPAWYPDPQHPGRVRRWNGRAWTAEVRPLPDWLRTVRLSPGPPAKVRRASARLWMASAALLLAGAVVMVFLGAGRDDADRIGDERFVATADARCAETETAVVTPNRRSLPAGPREARRIDALAAGWEDMVRDLREIPTEDADATKVDRWLRAWERWTALGRDYADAIRAGDDAEATSILRRSEQENAVMTRFALVNGMDACLFR